MKLSILAPVAFLAGSSLAQTPEAPSSTIEAALWGIDNTTQSLSAAVANWDGWLVHSLPFVKYSTAVLEEIEAGTEIAKAAPMLADIPAIYVAVATEALGLTVNASLGNIIAAKPKFDRRLMTPIVLLQLKQQQKATEEMQVAILEKIPEWMRGMAEDVVKPIEEAFVRAIDVFNGPF